MHRNYLIITFFAIIETIIGILGGNIFISSDFSYFEQKELTVSIPLFYLGLLTIFFISTIIPGFVNLVILRLQRKFLTCILLSIAGGFIFLVTYSLLFSFLSYTLNLRIVPLFLLLLGFVGGFNLSLFKILEKSLKNQKAE